MHTRKLKKRILGGTSMVLAASMLVVSPLSVAAEFTNEAAEADFESEEASPADVLLAADDASVAVMDEAMLAEAMERADAESSDSIEFDVSVNWQTGIESVYAVLTGEALDILVAEGEKTLSVQMVDMQIPGVRYDPAALAQLDEYVGDQDLIVYLNAAENSMGTFFRRVENCKGMAADVETWEGLQRIKPLPDLTGDVYMKVTIPYEMADGEDPDAVYGVYIDDEGQLQWLEPDCEPDLPGVSFCAQRNGFYDVEVLDLEQTELYMDEWTSGRISMVWTAVDDAEGYTIWYKEKGSNTTRRKIVSANTNFWNHRDLKPGTCYQYTVRPFVKTSNGNVFGPASKTLKGYTRPKTPRIQNVTVNGKNQMKVRLAGPAAGAERYIMCWSRTKDFESYITGVDTSSTVRTMQVNPGKGTWYVAAAAYVNADGKKLYSYWSNAIKVVIR